MTTNWPLLWIGLGMFVIGFVLRLYYGLKLKKMRESGTEQTDERAKTFKKIVWAGYVLFWGGTTMMIFSI